MRTNRLKTERPPRTEVYDRREAPPLDRRFAPGSIDEPRVVINGLSWRDYQSIGEALRDRPALRLTYNLGTLEIMTTSSHHEALKTLFARFVEIAVEELELDLVGLGSMTFQQAEERGLEPDECYWIKNAAKVRGVKHYDPAKHPPPDLTLEVEVTRSALPRMAMFAALGVREVWRLTSTGKLFIHRLRRDRTYAVARTSGQIPQLKLHGVPQLLDECAELSFIEGNRRMRRWVRAFKNDHADE